jgi:hypothetical protein
VNGTDLIAAVSNGFDATTGRYDQSFYGHLIAVMALQTFGEPVEQSAYTSIFDAQLDDGSWNFNGDNAPDTGDSNTTAMAVMTLAQYGAGKDAATAGINYLLTLQADDGSIGYDAASVGAGGGDANSTALAIQAILAVGGDPATAAPKGDLITALGHFQNPSGAFQFQPSMPDDSLLATAQAVPALLLQPLPIKMAIASTSPSDATQPTTAKPDCQFFEITQHNICAPFLFWWQAHGGVANFGYPLSEAVEMDGMTVQYFERARFEHHPEFAGSVWEVELTRYGADTIQRDHAEQAATVPASQDADCLRFEITGHNVCGRFAAFWEDHGGLPVFGYPMSEPFEQNGMTVQYFERARFEYQPGVWPERSDVLLGRLAAEELQRALAR